MAIKPEHIINLKGKQFVLLAGLLAEAHANGLISIETDWDREASDPKEHFWVFRAIGRFKTAEGEAVWSAMGEAAPWSSQMKGAYLRHAETRAIARMLRMATNVGMCSVEEMGPDGQTEDDPNGRSAGVGSGGQSSRSAAPARQPAARQQMDEDTRPVRQAAGPVVGEPPEDEIDAVVAQMYPPVGEAVCAKKGCGSVLTLEEMRDCARERLLRPCCAEHLLGYLKSKADTAKAS